MQKAPLILTAALVLAGCASGNPYGANPPIGSVQRLSVAVPICGELNDVRHLRAGTASWDLLVDQGRCGYLYANEAMRVVAYEDDGHIAHVQATDRPEPNNYGWIGYVPPR